MTGYWLSWYHSALHGEFELHTPWWISGSRIQPWSDTIVAAVQAESEEAAWEVVRNSYDNPPETLEKRFIDVLPDGKEPWTGPEGRFPRADWMVWA